jgi:FG-GAP repeat
VGLTTLARLLRPEAPPFWLARRARIFGLTGKVYVFSRSNNSWNQTQALIADDGASFDEFGASLTLDRVTALVGAPHATANGHGAQGGAYVFTISGGTLTQTQKIPRTTALPTMSLAGE